MSKQSTPLLTLTMVATGALLAHRFVHAALDQAVADENAIGVARSDAQIGEQVPVDVLGTTVVEAGAAVAAGTTVKADAQGRAIAWAASGARLGIALQAAGAAGQFIEVLLIPNAV